MRTRHVYPTAEIPHLWYHQTQPDARSAGNIFFDGDTIYSYGTHFPIARHVISKSGRKKAVLFTTRHYSVTTSKHCSDVRGSIPRGVTVFEVPSVNGDHVDNLASFVTESKDRLAQATRARKQGSYNLGVAFNQRTLAKEYAAFFGLKAPRFDFLPKGTVLKTLKAKLAEREARAKVPDDAKRDRQRARYEAQRIKNAKREAENIDKWRAGEYSGYMSHVPVMLRINGDQVETSMGARVPIDHARRGLEFVRLVVRTGREYKRNGHTEHLGNYAIDRVEPNGTLHAGCHVISYDEIQRIAPALA